MNKKNKKSVPLDSFAYSSLFIIILGFIAYIYLLIFGIIKVGEKILTAPYISFMLILLSILVFLSYSMNPLPFLLTRMIVDEKSIKLKRGKKNYIFELKDIEEIAVVRVHPNKRASKKRHSLDKIKLFFCISKKKDFFLTVADKKKKLIDCVFWRPAKHEYLITNEQCLINTDHLNNLKSFLSQYHKEILNLEKYKNNFENNDYLYLCGLAQPQEANIGEEQTGM